MQTAQALILDRIAANLTLRGYVPAVQFSYGNMGTVYAYRPGADHARAAIDFSFETNLYTLALTVDGVKVPSQVGRADYFQFRQQFTEPTRFWSELDALGVVEPEPRFMFVWGGVDRSASFATLGEMLHDNLHHPEFCLWLRSAAVGAAFVNGGAAPVVTTWRIA